MKRLLSVFLVLILAFSAFVPIVAAQDTLSAGCMNYASSSGTVPANFSDTFASGEVISVSVTSPDGALFNVMIGGNLLLTNVPSNSSTNFTVTADGSVTIDIAITNTGTGTYSISCTGQDEAHDFLPGTVCHFPPGNPNAAHTINVGEPAVAAHLAHGDMEGPCPPGVQTRYDNLTINITIFIIYATGEIQFYDNCTADGCDEAASAPISQVIDLNQVVNWGDDEDDNDDNDSQFIYVEDPEDYDFALSDANLSDGMYIVIFYLHPDPDNPDVGVFQINVFQNGVVVDDSILLFITMDGTIILWTGHSYWDTH